MPSMPQAAAAQYVYDVEKYDGCDTDTALLAARWLIRALRHTYKSKAIKHSIRMILSNEFYVLNGYPLGTFEFLKRSCGDQN